MMQILEEKDGPCLPHDLSIMSTYTKMIMWSKGVAVIVKNLTTALITITKGVKITQVVAANAIPQVGIVPGMLEKLDEMQGVQRVKMSVEQRKEALSQQLDLSDLEGWSSRNWAARHTLLAEYHDIFSLDPGEMGCTDLEKHEVKVADDEPFKERFWRIPPPLIDEVHAQMKEMLEAGTVCQSQSPWCTAVVLVHKKDWGLHFCIDFHKLNARTKKDSYLLRQIQEAIDSLVGTGYFPCFDLKAGFWQITMDEASKHYPTFTVGNIGFFECKCMQFGLCNTWATFQRLMQNCLGELNLAYCLIYLDDVIIISKMEEEHLHHLYVAFDCFIEHSLKLKPTKCEFFRNEINYFTHHVSKEGVQPSKENLKAMGEFTPPQTYTAIQAFLGLVGHYQWFIQGFTCIMQPLHEHLSGEGVEEEACHTHGRCAGCLWDA